MDAKAKAHELVQKFYSEISGIDLEYLKAKSIPLVEGDSYVNIAKKCALIAINEMVDFLWVDDLKNNDCHWANSIVVKRLYDIKKEIHLTN